MKILQISSTFPVSDASGDNPYVYNFIIKYRKKYGSDFAVLKPESFLPHWLASLTKRKQYWKQKLKIRKTAQYEMDSVKISILPYISVGSISAFHTFFAQFVVWLNRKKIKKLNIKSYNILHAHFLFPDGIMAYQLSKKYNIPYAITVRHELRFLNNPYSKHWVKKILHNASVVTTHSVHMLNGLKKTGSDNVIFLPTGIEEYFFDFDSETILFSKTSSGTRKVKGKLRLLSVCNLLPIKNLESVLKSLASMPEQSRIEYTIYGTGPIEKKLKEMVSKLKLNGVVHFKGDVKNKDLPAIMPEYDVFIQPSFKETYGLSYFEALACGLPVILTENTGAYELIKDKDVYYVVDPHNPQTITSCLQSILNDRKTLRQKAVLAPEAAVIASWDKFVDYFHEKYEEIWLNPSISKGKG